MQLVLLCRESDLKTFSANVVFSKLVADLKVLESSGISFDNETVKGSLLCIVGDNLGSHMIRGFQESFIVDCFCRFCEIHRNESPINKRGSPRTVAGYKNSVTYAVDDDDDEFRFNDASTHEGHLRQNGELTWFCSETIIMISHKCIKCKTRTNLKIKTVILC